MEKNRQNRNKSSNRQDENRNLYRDGRYDFDNYSQRTNYGNENTQRNFGQRSSDYYGPDYGNEYGQDLNRGQQNRGAYDQTRWPNDNNSGNNNQSDQFARYQDYDRGFNNTGGYGGSADNDASWGQSNRNPGLTKNNNFNSQRNWSSGSGRNGEGSAGLGYGGSNYGNDYQQRNSYGNMNRGYNDYDQRNQDRNWFDRSRDEVSSWFGDDQAEQRRRMDEVQRKSHKGKGPKDYQRSESRIREDISDRFSDDDDLDASDIDVKVSGNEVILSGTVENREAKRRAEDIAESVSGVSNVQNQLRIGNSSTGNALPTSTKEKPAGNSLKNEKMHHN